jgi:hypothetical protein
MSANPNVALCVGTYEIEGTAALRGHPAADENKFFAEEYRRKHPGYFDTYLNYPDEVVVQVNIHRVRQWRYIEGKPFLAETEFKEEQE